MRNKVKFPQLLNRWEENESPSGSFLWLLSQSEAGVVYLRAAEDLRRDDFPMSKASAST